MTKADIAKQIAKSTGLTGIDTSMVVEEMLDAIKEALVQGKRIEIRGFGVFKVAERAPKVARNPNTGEEIPVPRRRAPVFVPSKLLRARVLEH
jgi:nucleoid DNA-binding protein